MSLNSEQDEIADLMTRLLDNLSMTMSSQVGSTGAEVRSQIGRVRANYMAMIRDVELSTELLKCFTLAREAGATIASMVHVREQLFKETPVGVYPVAIVDMAMTYCLAAESRMLTDVEFVSRDDVQVVMARMKKAFDTATDIVADRIDSSVYQALLSLHGALTHYLAAEELMLPRMIRFSMPNVLPSLSLSNRIYYDPSRSEELVDENKIVHPAFCLREIRGLSA